MKYKKPLIAFLATFAIPLNIYAKDIEKTLDVEFGGTLNLRTDAGSVEIETHNQNTAIIEVSINGKNKDNFEVSIEEKNNEVIVIGEREGKKSWGSWNSPKVKYYITLPEQFNIELKTAGGSIQIEDITGDVDANTSGGSIRISSITGEVDIHTSGGSIDAKNIVGEIDAHTSGGSIDAIFKQQPNEDARFTTSGGSIHARFPKDIAIEIDASTSGGRVSSEFDVDGRVKKQSIRGLINGGGPEIELRTSGGSVSIDKR